MWHWWMVREALRAIGCVMDVWGLVSLPYEGCGCANAASATTSFASTMDGWHVAQIEGCLIHAN